MNIQEFADKLNGREYGSEITREEAQQARELGFVVVYGASDDLMEFEGAIRDELGAGDGGYVWLNKDGIFQGCEHDPDCECKYILNERAKCRTIEAVWAEGDYSWTYKTDIPHATFEIFDEGQPYCRGIVFEMKELEGERAESVKNAN